MNEKLTTSTRGILQSAKGKEKFTLSRFEPSPALQAFVEHYWIILYDLQGEPDYTQTVLSFPNVNLAFEQDDKGRRALIYGIPERPFIRTLSGTGSVLGIKFRAGGFHPFWKQDVSKLTGRTIAASDLFGPEIEIKMNAILDAGENVEMAKQAEYILTERMPESDWQVELASRIVRETMNDRSMIKVEQMSEQFGMSIRQLQRLFNKYVGVSPKWIIKRFRLQEAAERLEQDESVQMSELSMQLGYFDQAHFIRDFKSVLNQSPTMYKKT